MKANPEDPPITRRRALAGMIAVLTIPSMAWARQDILDALKLGGHVIYFRHGATTRSGIDRIEWPRERQRLLSDLGIEQSRIIGEAFQRHAIPVGEVLASPFARCRDMAEIAFGRVEERMELLGLLSHDQGRDDRIAYLTQKLTSLPAANANRIIVSHTSNIQHVANGTLAEGEAVVLRPNGTGFEIRGTLMPEDW